jgi:glycosyltransferase involved in cell wall biosynthesis
MSVIIPARNAAATIGEQLAALAKQTYDGEWDLIVVDNDSTDDTRRRVEQADPSSPLRLIGERQRGTNRARNAGAAAAKGDFLLFVDADDVVAPTWLEEMARAAVEADAVCGTLDRTRFTPPRYTAPGRGITTGLTPWSRFLPFAPGANFGVRASAFDALGGFDPSYSHGGDDVEFSWRLQLKGYTISFVPEAVVYYRERDGLREIARQFVHYGRQDPHLYRDFREFGVPPISVAQTISSYGYLLVHAPRFWSTPHGRRQWVRSAARRLGRVRGSIEWRTRYL